MALTVALDPFRTSPGFLLFVGSRDNMVSLRRLIDHDLDALCKGRFGIKGKENLVRFVSSFMS